MILLDNTQIILSTIFTQYNYSDNREELFSEDTVRHIVLNTYRFYKSKFGQQYGNLVICDDAGDSWRKDVFPHYKASRKKTRETDGHDWSKIFDAMNKIRKEVRENFPYKVMCVERCEADDIIATLCMNYNNKEKILIVSSDKDFQQLQRYTNVKQYSPIHKNFIYCENPQNFLKEHILRGDTSDGIPNVLSDDDTFIVEGKRQKPLSQKKLEIIIENIPEYLKINYNRNQKLVDLSYIPKEYTDKILSEYKLEPTVQGKEKLFEYFVKNKLSNLMEVIDEF
jgi:5'-3' exonuclease